MGLPYLYAAPQDADDWKKWSFVHAANHYDIIAAVQNQKGQQLAQFILDPMDPDNLGTWMYQHQEMHNQANAALGTSGFDLLGLDWTKDDEFQIWLKLNGSEHTRLSALLGIG